MGNFVKAKQVPIRVETGIYEEDYPNKIYNNVSLKGDEFRRVLVKSRTVSQSKWAQTYPEIQNLTALLCTLQVHLPTQKAH